MKMSFWESLALTPTYDLVFASISVILILAAIIYFIHLGVTSHKEKKLVNSFLKDNQDKIDYVKSRIMFCNTLEKLDLINRWATSIAVNLRTEMSSISDDYGYECGSKILKEFNNLISLREEELTTRKILFNV